MSKHTELLEKIKPLLEAIKLPPGATFLQVNDCADHSYSLLLSLKMGARPYMLYKHTNTNTPYTWLVGHEASHPDTKVEYCLNRIVLAVKKQLRAIPGITVRRHASPKPIYSWDCVEQRMRKEGYDRAYIEFDVEFYPQD